ncbi:ArdC family protein [Pontibacter indicus]|uniref:Antirestriction protein ArdC n=1 Tax=Pontibacter indicus TaxID=1317125 RepID=A0A1R3XQD9_9BACT|nr:zincin-like metallopeptidase domain-containing protein [Pontibacter indicus]SIT93954.1 Antirestriction protein ArdC [Pontibacter indicus]
MNAYQKFNQLAGQVTNEIMQQLEQGQVLWQKPWSSYGLPKNYGSGRPYGGFNAFYLNYVTARCHYTAPYFVTFKQAQALGGRVRKGEQGTPIVYWKIYDGKQITHPKDQEVGHREKEGKKCVPFFWTVFNIDQVEGVDFRLPEIPERSGQQLIEACQDVVDGFPSPRPRILHGGAAAWYAPATDTVQLPEPGRFHSSASYYATLFHELIHATGHATRLNRFTREAAPARFGDEAYSKEELIAEMGASFLCAYTGIREAVFQNTVAYLQGWISCLREDKTLLLYAGTRAFKAASYLLALNAEAERLPTSELTRAAQV